MQQILHSLASFSLTLAVSPRATLLLKLKVMQKSWGEGGRGNSLSCVRLDDLFRPLMSNEMKRLHSAYTQSNYLKSLAGESLLAKPRLELKDLGCFKPLPC
ncbi:hypothetical protein KIL84_007109 [Mauremys mutica]|uniref:Uncharacterized protein n=1 Tax=Mauremys mutica TaxID=74926 RepID=A0A9D3X269_9SAUR|nr:hypothetical protein KIL84_007109 [Mauremys mutica]